MVHRPVALAVAVAATLWSAPAFAFDITLDAVAPVLGIAPCVKVGSQADTVFGSIDLHDDLAAALTAETDGTARDVSVPLGFVLEGAEVRTVTATCGREVVTLFPATEDVTLPEACLEGIPLDVAFSDGSALAVTLVATGDGARGGFESPLTVVGFNPQPEPPGMPILLTFGFQTPTSAIQVALVEAAVTSAAGETESTTWR